MSSSGSTNIPWNKIREPVPQGVQVLMCFCGSLCKLMESKVLGDDFGRRFFMCDNYEYDPPKRYGKDKLKVSPRTIYFEPSEYSQLNLTRLGNRVHHLFVTGYGTIDRS